MEARSIIKKIVSETIELHNNILPSFDFLNELQYPQAEDSKQSNLYFELNEAKKKVNEHISKVEEEIQRLESDIIMHDNAYLDLLKKKEILEEEIEEICGETVCSVEDEEILKNHKQRLCLYKDITGIKWDYSVSRDYAKGYVHGYLKDSISAFKIPPGNSKQEKVWKEIEKASLFNYIKSKENLEVGVNLINRKE